MDKAAKIMLGVVAVLAVLAIGVGAFTAGLVTAGVAKNTVPPVDLGTSSPTKGVNPHGGITVPGSAGLQSTVQQVQSLLLDQALVPPTETSLTATTIDGMLKSLGDPYAMYFNPTHYKAFNEMEQGAFGGIGVTVGENKKGEAYVVNVIDTTPAQKAGVKAGDIFASIDGTTQPKWTSEQVVKLVRGKPGTIVAVGFRRGATPKPIAFKITRAEIRVPNTKAEMVGPNKDIGYIRLFSFNANAPSDLRKDIKKLDAKGAKGFILDLRDNPGGLLQAGIDVVSLFVKSGPAVRVDERNKPEHVYYVTGETATSKPMVVLVNADSASASEIAAGALQDYGRAIIVGVKSFGKGSVQTVGQLSNGGAVKFTIAHYLTPEKRVIDKKGVIPDVIIPMDAAKQANAKTDTQLQQAISALQQKLGK
jgi:carboxyl-terminal processing protease